MRLTVKALTILELTITLAIVTVIGLSAMGVTMVLSKANAQNEQSCENTQAGKGAMMKIQELINKSRLVTARDENCLVLWQRDSNDDGKINLSELVLLWFDNEARAIKKSRVVFPEDMTPEIVEALNFELSLHDAAQITTIRRHIEQDSNLRETVVVNNVKSFKVVAWPQCPGAEMVRMYMIVGDSEGTELVLQTAASLRVNDTERIGTSEGMYMLREREDPYYSGWNDGGSSDDTNYPPDPNGTSTP